MQFSLTKKVSDQIDAWLALKVSRLGKREWIHAKEGKVYLRFNSYANMLQLAVFEIDPEFQMQGVSREIIETSVGKGIGIVSVENIQVPKWAAKVADMLFPDRETRVKNFFTGDSHIPVDEPICCVTVEFIKDDFESHLSKEAQGSPWAP